MDVTGIERLSQNSLENASHKEGIWWPIALGAALGPVFSSCNPTYTVLLATILPASITVGLIWLLAYFVGLGIVLLLIVHFGRSIIGRFSFFTNPHGFFRRMLGIIILIVGLLIITGNIKKLEAYIIDKNIFVNTLSIDNILNGIILKNHNNVDSMCADGKCDNKKENTLNIDLWNAPELAGIAAWINSDPLTMASLRGKVVLIDFWTYSCINCIRTQPFLNAWYEKYEQDGLVIIGVHAPEFAFEKVERNVREAVKKAGIKYPVALDNDFTTWNAYNNRYWPAKYLIDKDGRIVYKHFGEGEYEETEEKIKSLLTPFLKGDEDTEENKGDLFINKSSVTPTSWQLLQEGANQKTPETYLGSARSKPWTFDLTGSWDIQSEYIESAGDDQFLKLRFSAKKVFIVVSSAGNKGGSLFVQFVDAQGNISPEKKIIVTRDDIYTVFDGAKFEQNGLLIIKATSGLRLHAFTFWE